MSLTAPAASEGGRPAESAHRRPALHVLALAAWVSCMRDRRWSATRRSTTRLPTTFSAFSASPLSGRTPSAAYTGDWSDVAIHDTQRRERQHVQRRPAMR